MDVLKKIYWSPYTAGGFYDYNIANTAPTSPIKLNSFNTYMDTDQLQQGVIDIDRADDYIRAKDRLRGSCINSKNEYYYNFCYCEDFTGKKLITSDDMDANLVDGINLTGLERIFQILGNYGDANNAGTDAVNHIFFYVTQKQLDITNDTITIS